MPAQAAEKNMTSEKVAIADIPTAQTTNFALNSQSGNSTKGNMVDGQANNLIPLPTKDIKPLAIPTTQENVASESADDANPFANSQPSALTKADQSEASMAAAKIDNSAASTMAQSNQENTNPRQGNDKLLANTINNPGINSKIYIQAGTFSLKANADKTQEALKVLGNVVIKEIQVDNSPMYRVRLGPIEDNDMAQIALKKVISMGHPDAIIINDNKS